MNCEVLKPPSIKNILSASVPNQIWPVIEIKMRSTLSKAIVKEEHTPKVPRLLLPSLCVALARAGAMLGTAALPAPWGMGGVWREVGTGVDIIAKVAILRESRIIGGLLLKFLRRRWRTRSELGKA
jgi:hypothetical protein